MGARAYAPELGAWTSVDPVALEHPERGVGASFAANNPYSYAGDSPVVAVDRDGHFLVLIVAAIVIGSLITVQYANAPESAATPLLNKSDADLALDTAHNAAMVYGTATLGAGAVAAIEEQGAVGLLKVGTNVVASSFASEGMHQVADTLDPSGRLGKVADIALVAQANVPSEGAAARVGPPAQKTRIGAGSRTPRIASPAQRARALERATGSDGKARCVYCGTKLRDRPGRPNSAEIDHAKAYSRGGKTVDDNLNASCRRCNREKGKKDLGTEWIPPKDR
jgi:RHS repeat-associated protein